MCCCTLFVLQHYQYCWVVDPIDGTKEFIKRNGEFTVMIGLVQVRRYTRQHGIGSPRIK
jgi:3'-phosphoadenosine 5'-phosphosulfate (PAPS) 3'-phosphatase